MKNEKFGQELDDESLEREKESTRTRSNTERIDAVRADARETLVMRFEEDEEDQQLAA